MGWNHQPDIDCLECLDDHPIVSKLLTTMVIVSPLSGVVGPLPNGLYSLQMGFTNYLLTGMILQGGAL